MEIDESGWPDLNERLDAIDASPEESAALVAHVSARLVGHFGADAIECFSGKDEPRRHAMREVAAAAIAHLAPLLAELPAGAISTLIESGKIGSPVPAPWDEHWRTQGRTASWRS